MIKKIILMFLISVNIYSADKSFKDKIDKRYYELEFNSIKNFIISLEDILNKNPISLVNKTTYYMEYKYNIFEETSKMVIKIIHKVEDKKLEVIEKSDIEFNRFRRKYSKSIYPVSEFYDIKIIEYFIDDKNNKINIILRNDHWWYRLSFDYKLNDKKIYSFYNFPEKAVQLD
ncbi:MAG: hypothetical protein OEZ22_09215 [Spirochaetia bacterium]|nr:hypothetical protein [Spirochaetia bacterium]